MLKDEKVCESVLEKVWEKLLKNENVWESVLKAEEVCYKLRKYAKS